MKQITYKPPVYELLNEEGLERLHRASMQVLSELGIAFYDEESRDILKAHGAEVDGQIVRFDPALVEEYVAKAPDRFTQLARNPENNLEIGGEHVSFAPVYGPPFVMDMEGGRRRATLEDFQNFVKLAYMSPYIHHSGGTLVEPNDEPDSTRHLDMLFSHIKFGDKAFMGSVTSGENAADSVEMAAILFGADAIREHPALVSLINANSPRVYDDRMLDALKVYARARQAVVITPFVLAGAMAPASVAGTVVQQNAEALAGIAFAQMVEPGTPVIYGSFLTNIDLQDGSPVFGSPESQVGLYASAGLARRYGLPFRGGGMFTAAKIPDAQSAYESLMVMLPTIMARANLVIHAAGWLDGGLVAGYEKFVLDCEILGMLHTWAGGIDLSDEALALDAITEVEPGGHYLGTEHTMRHFRDAFYRSELFEHKTVDEWEMMGAEDACKRAFDKVKRMLADYQPPPLDPAVEEALVDYVSRRKASIGG